MTYDTHAIQSTTSQILELFLQKLEEHEEFDDEIIKKLKELAQNGDLTSNDKISTILIQN